ncbi:hypothetical protein [Streptomyces canus]|uniref:hypothetical protein n=1 Tax=Streptomyces canus TaxID=58343 RepID=UPI0033A28633
MSALTTAWPTDDRERTRVIDFGTTLREVTAASDVFSLGSLLVYAATGNRSGASPNAAWTRIRTPGPNSPNCTGSSGVAGRFRNGRVDHSGRAERDALGPPH